MLTTCTICDQEEALEATEARARDESSVSTPIKQDSLSTNLVAAHQRPQQQLQQPLLHHPGVAAHYSPTWGGLLRHPAQVCGPTLETDDINSKVDDLYHFHIDNNH